MKFNILLSALLGLAAACGSDGESTSPIKNAADAKARAEALIAGATAQDAESEGDLWKVEVKTDKGATLDVEIHADDGELAAIEGEDAPFDYTFDPGMGLLTYEAAKEIAFGEVTDAKTVEKWELSLGGETAAEAAAEAAALIEKHGDSAESDWEYEFYVRDAAKQLWEIKLDAASGEVRSGEKKDAVD